MSSVCINSSMGVNDLPNEILLSIFAACLPPNPVGPDCHLDDDVEGNLSLRSIQWTLSFVSHRWRQLALSAPELWSTLVFPNTVEGSGSISTNLVIAQLERASNRPLSFKLQHPAHQRVFQALLSNVGRWKRVFLGGNAASHHFKDHVTSDLIPLRDSLSQSTLPHLEFLHIDPDILSYFPPLTTTHTPNLRSLSVNSDDELNLSPIIPSDASVLSQLDHLATEFKDWMQTLPIMTSAAHRLQSLQLLHTGSSSFVPALPEPLTFPHVRRLVFTSKDIGLISQFSFPSLEELVLSFPTDSSPEDTCWLEMLPGWSGLSTVTSLTLSNFDNHESIVRLLQNVPLLESLTLRTPAGEIGEGQSWMLVIEKVLEALTLDSSQDVSADTLCPRLNHFAYIDPRTAVRLVPRIEAFTKLIKSRQYSSGSTATLRSTELAIQCSHLDAFGFALPNTARIESRVKALLADLTPLRSEMDVSLRVYSYRYTTKSVSRELGRWEWICGLLYGNWSGTVNEEQRRFQVHVDEL